MCCVYCSEHCLCAAGTVVHSVCVLWILLWTVSVFCVYGREQCVCAVATVGNSGCVLWLL